MCDDEDNKTLLFGVKEFHCFQLLTNLMFLEQNKLFTEGWKHCRQIKEVQLQHHQTHKPTPKLEAAKRSEADTFVDAVVCA